MAEGFSTGELCSLLMTSRTNDQNREVHQMFTLLPNNSLYHCFIKQFNWIFHLKGKGKT